MSAEAHARSLAAYATGLSRRQGLHFFAMLEDGEGNRFWCANGRLRAEFIHDKKLENRSWGMFSVSDEAADERPLDSRVPHSQSSDLRPFDSQSSDLRPFDLQSSDLRPFDMQSSDLRPSDLRPSDLRPSDLRPSDLQPFDLRPSDLQPSDLQFSDPFQSPLDGSLSLPARLDPPSSFSPSSSRRAGFLDGYHSGVPASSSFTASPSRNGTGIPPLMGQRVGGDVVDNGAILSDVFCFGCSNAGHMMADCPLNLDGIDTKDRSRSRSVGGHGRGADRGRAAGTNGRERTRPRGARLSGAQKRRMATERRVAAAAKRDGRRRGPPARSRDGAAKASTARRGANSAPRRRSPSKTSDEKKGGDRPSSPIADPLLSAALKDLEQRGVFTYKWLKNRKEYLLILPMNSGKDSDVLVNIANLDDLKKAGLNHGFMVKES